MSDERSWTVLELLNWTKAHFEEKGIETARLDAETLLAFALEVRRIDLYVQFEKPVSVEERARFRDLVRQRGTDRVPVSHLLGSKEFWSLPLRVSAEVLTPRPETETLVAAAVDRLPERDGEYRVLDVGTGSGAVALSLAKERPKARVTGTDISFAALKIAAENAEELQLNENVRLLEGSLFEPVEGEFFDLIVSNPPYLAEREAAEMPRELKHEPETALYGGEDGFAVLEPLIASVGAHLVPGGAFAVEIDPRQADRVVALCLEADLEDATLLRDLAGRVRVVAATKAGSMPSDRKAEQGA